MIKDGSLHESPKTTYRINSLLNRGNFSDSFDAYDVKNDERVFLKFYRDPTQKTPWFSKYYEYQKELNTRLLNSRAERYCVLCREQFMLNPRPDSPKKREFLCLVYDFVPGGQDLKSLLDLNRLDWKRRKDVAKVFLSAMEKIHEQNVVHCDLKPENVQIKHDPTTELGFIPRMIDMDRSIMADQTAPWVTGEHKQGYTGTMGYMSPEHLQKKTPVTASDVFTVGIILCEVLAGCHPYAEYVNDKEGYESAILSTTPSYKPVTLLGPLGDSDANAAEFAAMIERCLSLSPSKRPTCKELRMALLKLDRVVDSGEVHHVEKAYEPAPEPLSTDVADGYIPREQKLLLKGENGTVTISFDMNLGYTVLKAASEEARYAVREQFRVERAADGWYICPTDSELRNNTGYCGSVLTERHRLKNGDEICLMGKTSGRKAMILTASGIKN